MPFIQSPLGSNVDFHPPLEGVRGRLRIISLVPSITELLYTLGLEDETIGITKFCVHPTEWFKTKTRVGGTKTINIEKIIALKPDLIIANKEENVKEQVEALAEKFPVWLTDVNNVEDALLMIDDIGILTGKRDVSKLLVEEIKTSLNPQPFNTSTLQPAAYLIWKEPYMTAGGDTFINDMLKHAGFKNAFENKKRYPIVSIEDLKNSGCEIILLSSEPYPFKQKHIDELKQYFPDKKIILVDGEMFSWYGSRMLKAARYFSTLGKSLSD